MNKYTFTVKPPHKPSRDTENRVFFGAATLMGINFVLGTTSIIPVPLSLALTAPILAFVAVYLYLAHHWHPEHGAQLVISCFITLWTLQTTVTVWLLSSYHHLPSTHT